MGLSYHKKKCSFFTEVWKIEQSIDNLYHIFNLLLGCEWCDEQPKSTPIGFPEGADLSKIVVGCVKTGTCPNNNIKERYQDIVFLYYSAV